MIRVLIGFVAGGIVWLLKLIVTNEYSVWAPKLAQRAVRVAAAVQPGGWQEVRRDEWSAELAFIAAEPGSFTGLSFALWIAGRELLRAGLALLWHPIEIAAAVLIVVVDWGLPGERWMTWLVYYSCLMVVMEIPYALFARNLRRWSTPESAPLKRFVWWVFTPDVPGERTRDLGCLVISMALVIRGLLNGQVLPLAVAFALIAGAIHAAHGTRAGKWLGALDQLQVDLRFRLAGDPPLEFPRRKRTGFAS